MINKLRSLLTKRDKNFLLGLFFFSIFISIIETVGISIIMPFMSVAIDFNLIHENEYYSYFYKILSFDRDISFIISFGVVLIFFYLFRSIINMFYFYLLSKFTQGRYHLLAYRLFENYMNMSYRDFTTKNSSTLTKTIVNEASYLTHLLSSVLLMFSEIFVVIFIYAMMLYVNYQITLLLTMVLILNALIMIKTVSAKIKDMGVIRAKFQKNFYEIINKSFGNFKLIKLHSNSQDVLEDFGKSSFSYAKANVTYSTMVHIPRLFLEAIAFSIIVAIITYLVWKYENNVSDMLAVISMFVLALYRLMPSINRIMNSYNQILFYHKSLDIIYDDLSYENENLGDENISFEQEIVIQNLDFEYEENKLILNGINLSIQKGSKIGFIGESGSGKSTLVDIIIGLYQPTNGNVFLDGILLSDNNIKVWRSKVGYIPQSVYLFDGTVGENVTFGLEYDSQKVNDVLRKAKIYDFLKSKEGENTLVGEGGVMLSGGQKQRIAIARALYSEPEVLVLDEATSALDDETEREIMDEIYAISEDKTLIIIAHRLSTIDRCDVVYKIENGELC
jgi:ABC-type multidrug transport system fused ATPase/permease subunit